jgi:hypothetical protein
MSINTLANAAAARRPDVRTGTVPDGASQIAAASATPPDKAPPEHQEASGTNTALNVLFGYIPTEVVTLYVAFQTALQPAKPPAAPAGTTSAAAAAVTASPTAMWITFWCFFAATPFVVWVVFASKLKDAGKPLPAGYDTWPVWEMTAALLSYCAWAFALPGSPFGEFPWYSSALAGLAVVLASTVLGLLAPLFQRPLGTGAAPPPAQQKPPVSSGGSGAPPEKPAN